jgi:hypothetical protein
LVLTFFVVGSIGAIEYLSSEADSETENQAACVETRPPVAGCQLSPVVPTTSTTAPGTPPPVPPPPGSPPDPCDSGDPPAECYEPPPPPPTTPSNSASATTPTATEVGGLMHVSQTFTVTAPGGGGPVAGAVIEIQIKVKNPSPPPTFYPVAHYPTCTTDATGTCTIEFDIPEADGVGWELAIFKITSSPPTTRPTTVWDFNR